MKKRCIVIDFANSQFPGNILISDNFRLILTTIKGMIDGVCFLLLV